MWRLCFLTFFIIIQSTVSNSFYDDAACQQDFKILASCNNEKYNSSRIQTLGDPSSETRKAINKCLTKHGCDLPEYDKIPVNHLSPTLQSMTQKFLKQWANTPAVVKQCLEKRTLEIQAKRVNDCLLKENVSTINFSKSDTNRLLSVAAGFITGLGPAEAANAGGKTTAGSIAQKGFVAKINTARAFRLCDGKVGTGYQFPNSTSLAFTCLQPVNIKFHQDYCASIHQPCSSKIPPKCQNRSDEIQLAICRCKKEYERGMLQRLDKLLRQAKGGPVPLGDTIKLLDQNDNPLAIIKMAAQCYLDNNLDPPEAFNLGESIAAAHANSPNSNTTVNSAKITIDNETLATLGDMLTYDALDENECSLCQ